MAQNYFNTLLIFPINIEGVETITRYARMLGFRVIGATSVTNYSKVNEVKDIIYLPYVGNEDFQRLLMEAIEEYSVDKIWTPHHAVWSFLKILSITNTRLRDALCGDHPFIQNWNLFKDSNDWARSMHSDLLIEQVLPHHSAIRRPLSTTAYSSIHRGFLRIPGESDLEKLHALCSIVRGAPAGDVVEIGSLYGRSAYALGRLANAYGIGSCICVDAWSMAHGANQGSQAALLEYGLPYIDFEHIFTEFLATATEVPDMSYIRLPSAVAILKYNESAALGFLASPELPTVPITGHISILHIDGNHRVDEVRIDIETWVPLVVFGGWVLIDDYVWSFGDGPKVAGDELIESGLFDISFCISDTLFLRRKPIDGELRALSTD